MSRSIVRVVCAFLLVVAFAYVGANTGIPIAALAAAFAQILRALPVA